MVGGGSGVSFSCDKGYAHNNLTEYTIGVGVCPPAGNQPGIGRIDIAGPPVPVVFEEGR